MKYSEYAHYVNESKDYESPEEMMSQYGYPTECSYSPEQLATVFEIIFAAAANDVEKLRQISGKNSAEFERRYGIPHRSFQNWKLGTSAPLRYLTTLIGFAEISEIPFEIR